MSRRHLRIIFAYNVGGRGGTDGNDQNREKLAIATRRIKRDGVKGAMFGIDLLFSCGHIVWLELAERRKVPLWRLDKEYTIGRFKRNWADAILRHSTPLRKRVNADQTTDIADARSVAAALTSPAARTPSPAASARLQTLKPHRLVDMGRLAREGAKRWGVTKKSQRKKGKSIKKGVCGLKGNGCNIMKPKRSPLRCRQCKKYFHLECFFKCHQCIPFEGVEEGEEGEEGEESDGGESGEDEE